MAKARDNHVKRKKSESDYLNTDKFFEKAIATIFIFFLNSHHVTVLVWLLWLTISTVFYVVDEDVTVLKGFYENVNVGYSIFWQKPPLDTALRVSVSLFHLFVGSVMIR